MSERTEARVVLVTGAGGGIGGATSALFAARGWTTVAVDRAGGPGLEQADVADEAVWQRLIADLERRHGRLDAVVNNAAVQIAKPISETTVEEWDELMASNLRSVFLGAKHARRSLAATRGALVNVSSVHAVATSRNIAAYAASKGAVLALTRALAIELADDGIRVNAVLPGAVDTAMLRAGLSRGHAGDGGIEERLGALARRTVMGRIAAPDEIARAIVFLADADESSFMTGHGLVVDGGATARLSTE